MGCLVDVNEMKIAIAVTEFSRACGVFFRRQRRIVTAETKIVIGNEEGSVKALRVLVCQQAEIRGAVRVVASGTIPVLDRAVGIRIRRQQSLHIGEFLFLILGLDRLVVALQTGIESVGKEQSVFLRRVRVVTVHAGMLFRDRGMPDRRCLQISDGFLVTFSAKSGECRRQHISLVGPMWRMAIRAPGQIGLMPESRIRKPRAPIRVAFQAHLRACNLQHSGNLPTMRIVAGSTSSGVERAMDKVALELVLFVALKTKRFRCLYKPRGPSFSRDLVAELAKILFRQQTIHF